MPEQNTQSRSNLGWFTKIQLLRISLGILAPLIFFGVVFTVGTMEKRGVEFSPDDFTTRSFSYGKIEWLNWTVSGLEHQDHTTLLQQSLVPNWIQPVTNSKRTWHLVSDSVTRGNSPDFDAKILHDYLQMPFWEDWNAEAKNAIKAKALWPAVATLARNYVYWAIPDLMDLAINQESLSSDSFVLKVNEISVQALLQRGDLLRSDGELEEAEKSLNAAVEFKKTKEILTARADVYDELDKHDLAKADRELADQLGDNNESN